jgi:hypothetical protein
VLPRIVWLAKYTHPLTSPLESRVLWAHSKEACEGANDGSRCFSQCCACDCKWAGVAQENCDAGSSDGSYCFRHCCPGAAASAQSLLASARVPMLGTLGASTSTGLVGGLVAQRAGPGAALGPVSASVSNAPSAGWVIENGVGRVEAGGFRVIGNTRAYLVQDARAQGWAQQRYARFDLMAEPLRMTVDLSQVPCGCLACVYLVAMPDPSGSGANYCDMVRDIRTRPSARPSADPAPLSCDLAPRPCSLRGLAFLLLVLTQTSPARLARDAGRKRQAGLWRWHMLRI